MFAYMRPHTIHFQEGLTPTTSQKWMRHYLDNFQYYEISGDPSRVRILLFPGGTECLHTWDHIQYIFKRG